MEAKYLWVGKVDKSFGTDGFNRLKINPEYEDIVFQQDFLFLLYDEIHVPFRIAELKKQENLIRFDDIDNLDSADALKARKVFVSTEYLDVDLIEEKHAFVGFTIIDNSNQETIGEIYHLLEMPKQVLAYVIYKDNEIMIPVHEDLIETINHESKEIFMNLPEGLLSL